MKSGLDLALLVAPGVVATLKPHYKPHYKSQVVVVLSMFAACFSDPYVSIPIFKQMIIEKKNKKNNRIFTYEHGSTVPCLSCIHHRFTACVM